MMKYFVPILFELAFCVINGVDIGLLSGFFSDPLLYCFYNAEMLSIYRHNECVKVLFNYETNST